MPLLKRHLSRIFPPLLLTAGLLLIWELLVRWLEVPLWLLPPPSAVILSLIYRWPLLWWHGGYTLIEALAGFILAMVVALLLAPLLDRIQWLKQAVYPLLVFSQAIPLMVLAVLLVIFAGFGLMPKILVVMLVCSFPILINLLNGLHSCDPDLISLFRSMNVKPGAIYRMVKFPAALPAFFAGLRISATYSIMAAVVAEWLGAYRGLGYFITLSQKSYQMDQLLAAVILICLFSFILVKLVDVVEYYVIPQPSKLKPHI